MDVKVKLLKTVPGTVKRTDTRTPSMSVFYYEFNKKVKYESSTYIITPSHSTSDTSMRVIINI